MGLLVRAEEVEPGWTIRHSHSHLAVRVTRVHRQGKHILIEWDGPFDGFTERRIFHRSDMVQLVSTCSCREGRLLAAIEAEAERLEQPGGQFEWQVAHVLRRIIAEVRDG